jgi:hypothetical protein
VGACVRACVCVCVWGGAQTLGRVHVRAPVALIIQHATRMRHIVLSFVASLAPSNFSTLSHKAHNFRKTVLNIKCVFRFCLQIF